MSAASCTETCALLVGDGEEAAGGQPGPRLLLSPAQQQEDRGPAQVDPRRDVEELAPLAGRFLHEADTEGVEGRSHASPV